MGREGPGSSRSGMAMGGGIAVLLLAGGIAPFLGSASIDLGRAWSGLEPDAQIFFDLRLSRVVLGLLAGGALAVAGALFQSLLRDALATPYTLGVSAGAALGAVTAISFGLPASWGAAAIPLFSILGSLLALTVVLLIASVGSGLSSFTLLLAGITVNTFATALIVLLHSTATFGQSFAITRWLMGGLEPVLWPQLAALTVVVLGLTAGIIRAARSWNLLAVGEEWAASRGISVRPHLVAGFLAGSLLTAAVTALCGPIGFVGLIVPHALRMRLGGDHRLLLPAAFLYGAAFLVACDMLARSAVRSAEIPVGVVTALLGGPFFVWLLRSTRRKLWP